MVLNIPGAHMFLKKHFPISLLNYMLNFSWFWLKNACILFQKLIYSIQIISRITENTLQSLSQGRNYLVSNGRSLVPSLHCTGYQPKSTTQLQFYRRIFGVLWYYLKKKKTSNLFSTFHFQDNKRVSDPLLYL